MVAPVNDCGRQGWPQRRGAAAHPAKRPLGHSLRRRQKAASGNSLFRRPRQCRRILDTGFFLQGKICYTAHRNTDVPVFHGISQRPEVTGSTPPPQLGRKHSPHDKKNLPSCRLSSP
jgi:hypothetical protein